MKSREATVALAFLASLGIYCTPSDGQDFLRPEKQSTPSNGVPCDVQFPSTVPIRCWVGQQFLVLPIDKDLRSYGYQDFKGGSGQYGFASYDELVGKTVTVTDVEWQSTALLPDLNWSVTFKADDTGTIYTANGVILPNEGPDQATIGHLALVRDLKGARDRYLGKSFWMLSGWLPELGENGAISFSNGENKYLYVEDGRVTAIQD